MNSKYLQQIKNSFYISFVVGTILIFINHMDAIISFSFTGMDLIHWSFNFVVPFIVSLYSRIYHRDLSTTTLFSSFPGSFF